MTKARFKRAVLRAAKRVKNDPAGYQRGLYTCVALMCEDQSPRLYNQFYWGTDWAPNSLWAYEDSFTPEENIRFRELLLLLYREVGGLPGLEERW